MQRVQRLLVGIVQLGKVGVLAADADTGRAAQGTLCQLADLIGKNVKVFLKVRMVAQQHRDNAPRTVENEMPQVFIGALLHKLGKAARVVRVARQRGRQHHQRAAVIHAAQQPAVAGGAAQAFLQIVGGVFVALQNQRNDKTRAVSVAAVGTAQPRIAGVDALMNGLQFCRKASIVRGLSI